MTTSVNPVLAELDVLSAQRGLTDKELTSLNEIVKQKVHSKHHHFISNCALIANIIARHSYLIVPDLDSYDLLRSNTLYSGRDSKSLDFPNPIKGEDGITRQPVTVLPHLVSGLINEEFPFGELNDRLTIIWDVYITLRRSFPFSIHNWTSSEFEVLRAFMQLVTKTYTTIPVKALFPFFNEFVDYLNAIIAAPVPTRFSIHGSGSVGVMEQFVDELIVEVNNNLTRFRTWYDFYLLIEAKRQGLPSSMPTEWLAEILEPPIIKQKKIYSYQLQSGIIKPNPIKKLVGV